MVIFDIFNSIFAVKKISGKARLQFTRVPYTHWSLSFYTDPILELDVKSQFQGRQLQPQIISLIAGQIRRAVRRKHTLPRYKMRYKPFFRRLNDEDIDLSEVIFQILSQSEFNIYHFYSVCISILGCSNTINSRIFGCYACRSKPFKY